MTEKAVARAPASLGSRAMTVEERMDSAGSAVLGSTMWE
jgi:hypothetical protein